jgi:hypothetical protein
MTTDEIRLLLERIRVHYPRTDVNVSVVDEWYRLIGYMDYSEALDLLDEYLMLEDGNSHAPRIQWFKKRQTTEATKYVPHHSFSRLDRKGRLIDSEGRMYAFPDRPDELYHYDGSGRILDSKNNLVR